MKLLTQNLKRVKKYYNVTLWLSCNEHQQLTRTLGDFRSDPCISITSAKNAGDPQTFT